ncbi:MAG: hypothetical protein JO126_05345 [Alphaproteobacteria bacterium]|nr:hypothetical protein [Alphaproteobacteria bacterium]MBV8548862.1 hypothetical protein [Alphaproteobacteria bacterium]
MVDSVNNGAVNSLLRTQQLAQTTPKAPPKVAQAIINQSEATTSSKNLVAANNTPPSANLPRGSLVDVTV